MCFRSWTRLQSWHQRQLVGLHSQRFSMEFCADMQVKKAATVAAAENITEAEASSVFRAEAATV